MEGNSPVPAHPQAGTTVITPIVPPPTLIEGLAPELANNAQYEVVRELGRGGMGVVYLAKNRLMARHEVLKVVNQQILSRPGVRERFLREIQSAAMLHHPNVVTAYSVLPLGDLLVFAMEYIEGEDLAQLVKKRGPLPVANACYYIQQAALGLQHAFEKRMVHRDIKPQNLILCREGKKQIVKVLDFGLAKVVREEKEDTALTGAGQAMGTPDYMAPEQILDAAKADIRADIYSLGCTLYYLLAARPPFEGDSVFIILLAHQSTEAPAVTDLRPEVPAELTAVVRKMMAKDPAQRFQAPIEVVQAMAPFIKLGSNSIPLASGAGSATTATDAAGEKRSHPPKEKPSSSYETVSGGITTSGPTTPGAAKSLPAPVKGRGAKKWLIAGGLALVLLPLALFALWSEGVFRFKAGDGGTDFTKAPSDTRQAEDSKHAIVSPARGVVPPTSPGTTAKSTGLSGPGSVGKKIADNQKGTRTAPLSAPSRVPEPAKPPDLEIGFIPLSGKDLKGWYVDTGEMRQWTADGDVLVGKSAGGRFRSYLLSTKEYEDFTLRFDFWIEPGGNAGVALRAIGGEQLPLGNGALVPDHPLIKLNDTAKYPPYPLGHWLKDNRIDGKPARVPALSVAAWHPMEVKVHGDVCVAFMGGERVLDLKLDPEPKASSGIVPALQRARGKIGFQVHTGTIRLRHVRIKELPSSGLGFATIAPGTDDDPQAQQIKKSRAGYEAAMKRADAALLAAFDQELEALPKAKMKAEDRVKLIDVVQGEKAVYKTKGRIPWSAPLRTAALEYVNAMTASRNRLAQNYDRVADACLRKKEEERAKVYMAEKQRALQPKVLAVWRYTYAPGKTNRVELYSDGLVDRGPLTWSWDREAVVLRHVDPKAKGGVWIDTCRLSFDGKSISGTNQVGHAKSGTLSED
jgi:serine/threonine protein kinase